MTDDAIRKYEEQICECDKAMFAAFDKLVVDDDDVARIAIQRKRALIMHNIWQSFRKHDMEKQNSNNNLILLNSILALTKEAEEDHFTALLMVFSGGGGVVWLALYIWPQHASLFAYILGVITATTLIYDAIRRRPRSKKKGNTNV